MSDIEELIDRVQEELDDVDDLTETLRVETSEWCELPRADVEQLLGIARMHAECLNSWTTLGPVGRALRDAAQGGRRG